jgi:hypothetical protein
MTVAFFPFQMPAAPTAMQAVISMRGSRDAEYSSILVLLCINEKGYT